MVDDAPGLFSITKVVLSSSPSAAAMMRETTSAPPPAPNGTTQVIGLDGQFCAWATGTDAQSPTSANSAACTPLLIASSLAGAAIFAAIDTRLRHRRGPTNALKNLSRRPDRP